MDGVQLRLVGMSDYAICPRNTGNTRKGSMIFVSEFSFRVNLRISRAPFLRHSAFGIIRTSVQSVVDSFQPFNPSTLQSRRRHSSLKKRTRRGGRRRVDGRAEGGASGSEPINTTCGDAAGWTGSPKG